jgi:hypothetical protein
VVADDLVEWKRAMALEVIASLLPPLGWDLLQQRVDMLPKGRLVVWSAFGHTTTIRHA